MKRFPKPSPDLKKLIPVSKYILVADGLGLAINNSINGKNRSESIKILPLSPRQSVEIGIVSARECSPAVSAFVKYLI